MLSATTGSRVELDENLRGLIRYVGPARLGASEQLEVWIGIELDFPLSSSSSTTSLGAGITGQLGDGMVANMRYFTCGPGRALFVRKADLNSFSSSSASSSTAAAAAAAVTVQVWVRRHLARKRLRAVIASHTWNVLDTHLEELGLVRGAAVLRAQQQLQKQEQQQASTGGTTATEEEVVERVMRLAEREVAELTMDSLAAIRVPKEYQGPHLRFPLTIESVKSMMEDFKNQPDAVLHYRYLMSLFLQSKALFAAESNVQEVTFPSEEEDGEEDGPTKLIIVGDIHGQIQDLFTIFALQGLPSSTNRFLFNGDFVDRGANGVEVLAVLCALKILFPQHVLLNRGNHEARAQNAWMGFEEELLTKYTAPHTTVKGDRRAALRVHLLCEQLFDALPLCAVVHNRVFVCHGGLFRNDGVTLQHLERIARHREPPLNGRSFEDRVFEDLLWSDPRPTPHYPRALHGRRSSDRGAGCEFGSQITNQFCKLNQIALVVRSHECVPEGFEVLHHGRLMTIFSASRYCGTQTNKGAYIVLERDLQPHVHQFYAQTQACLFITEDERLLALEADAVQMIVEQIVDRKVDLYWYFCQREATTGLVGRVEWANALCEVLGLHLPYLYYQRLFCDAEEEEEGSSSKRMINYGKFLARFRITRGGGGGGGGGGRGGGGGGEEEGWQDALVRRVAERLFAAASGGGGGGSGSSSLEQAWEVRFASSSSSSSSSCWAFADALRRLDSALTETQLYELMHCLDPDGTARVTYARFADKIGPHYAALQPAAASTPPPPSPAAAAAAASLPPTPDATAPVIDASWKQGVVQQVATALFQVRMHVRAAFRNFFDFENYGRISSDEFTAGLTAFNNTMQQPLTGAQIHDLTRALQDADGFVSYQEFFDSLSIVDQHEHPTQQLVRKSSSFYFQQLDRNDKLDKLVSSKKAAAAAKQHQPNTTNTTTTTTKRKLSAVSSSDGEEDDDDDYGVVEVSGLDDY